MNISDSEIVGSIMKSIDYQLTTDIKDISQMMHRWKRKTMDFRAVIAYTLNVFCGMNITEVCKYMKNITSSCCSRLCNMGFDVISKDNTIKSSILGI